MRSAHAAVIAAAAVLSSGCSQPLLTMQLEIPKIQITSPGHDFATGDPSYYCDQVTPGCVYDAEQFDLAAQVPTLNEKGVSFELYVTNVALHLVSGASNLNGVISADVKLQDPASGDWTVIASYTKPSGSTSDITDISVSGNSNIDLARYVSSGWISWRTEVTYDTSSPLSAFVADVRADFSLVVTMDYDAYL